MGRIRRKHDVGITRDEREVLAGASHVTLIEIADTGHFALNQKPGDRSHRPSGRFERDRLSILRAAGGPVDLERYAPREGSRVDQVER